MLKKGIVVAADANMATIVSSALTAVKETIVLPVK